MFNKIKIKLIKRSLVIIVLIGFLIVHFFIPRLITELNNPVVKLIKRNQNVNHHQLIDSSITIKRKMLTINTFDNIK
jgi:hypothetical protein